MNDTLTQAGDRKLAQRKRFGALLASAVILYIAAIILFIIVY